MAEVLINELAYKNKNIFIYRLGLITGDSKTGFTSNTDFLIIFLKGLSSLGQLPESCLELELDITPIDYASQAIIKISNSGTISRKFHIANKQGASLALIRKALAEQGRECKIVDDRTWKNLIRSNRKFLSCEIEAIKALCRFDLKNTYKQERIFDLFQASDTSFGQENTLAVLKNTNVKLPEINISLMSKYAAFAISKNSFVNCAKEVK